MGYYDVLNNSKHQVVTVHTVHAHYTKWAGVCVCARALLHDSTMIEFGLEFYWLRLISLKPSKE